MVAGKEELFSRSNFLEYPSYKKLNSLAENVLDLTIPGVLSPERMEQFCAEACGYTFLYGTERVTEAAMEALMGLAGEARVIEKMQRMQSGEVLNFIKGFSSENRAVLHTATRDFFDSIHKSGPAKEAAQMAKVEVEKLARLMEQIDREGKFTNMIMIGIGGSDLGPYANYLAMEYLKKSNRHLFFINNVDPDNAAAVLKKVDLEKTVVVVVSKSGTTLETATNELFVRTRFAAKGLVPKEHFIAVTGEGSPMDDPSQYMASFYIWDWIGGRYSSTSMVGGVMLAFAFGMEVYMEFLRGANAMDKAALSNDLYKNLPLLGALLEVWNRNFLHYPTLAVIPYSQALARFPAHIQQVEMESNGKHIDRLGQHVAFNTGPIIWGEAGTNAQHSFYQMIHQGTDTIPVEFIGFKESQYGDDVLNEGTTSQEKLVANLFAQMIGLAVGQRSDNPNKEFSGNRPSHLLLAKQATPFAVGALLAYFEHKVAFEGFIWNINSFDQEGVQLGKVLANKIIDQFKASHEDEKASSSPLINCLLKQLASLE